MARIRTIKPEFPQSESMGRVSRDARLCFVMLWTLADDEGRLRGSSRMLASLLYPYDEDSRDLIENWLEELKKENCIVRYEIDGDCYIQVTNWTDHQRIDRPSKSKIDPPPSIGKKPRESSRKLAKPREDSTKPREASTLDQGRDQGEEGIARASRLPASWTLPEAWRDWAKVDRPDLDPDRTADRFRDYWCAKAGKDGAKLDWHATWRNWCRNERSHVAQSAPIDPFAGAH